MGRGGGERRGFWGAAGRPTEPTITQVSFGILISGWFFAQKLLIEAYR